MERHTETHREPTGPELAARHVCTWYRLRSGDWGVKGPASSLAAGRTVEILKRSGEVSTATIDRVLFTDDTIAICSVARSGRARGKGRSGGGWASCPTCGGAMSAAYARKGYQCDSCADREEGPGF